MYLVIELPENKIGVQITEDHRGFLLKKKKQIFDETFSK